MKSFCPLGSHSVDITTRPSNLCSLRHNFFIHLFLLWHLTPFGGPFNRFTKNLYFLSTSSYNGQLSSIPQSKANAQLFLFSYQQHHPSLAEVSSIHLYLLICLPDLLYTFHELSHLFSSNSTGIHMDMGQSRERIDWDFDNYNKSNRHNRTAKGKAISDMRHGIDHIMHAHMITLTTHLPLNKTEPKTSTTTTQNQKNA